MWYLSILTVAGFRNVKEDLRACYPQIRCRTREAAAPAEQLAEPCKMVKPRAAAERSVRPNCRVRTYPDSFARNQRMPLSALRFLSFFLCVFLLQQSSAIAQVNQVRVVLVSLNSDFTGVEADVAPSATLGGAGRDATGAVFSTAESDPMIVHAANAPVFSLSENSLPPGSILLNREPGIWETNKQYVLGSILLVVAESLLIVGLILRRRKRQKSEATPAWACEHLRLVTEAARAVGWEWDVTNGRHQLFGNVEAMLGTATDVASAQGYDFRRHIHPEDRTLVFNALNEARWSRQPYVTEFRVIDCNGNVRWITARGSFSWMEHGKIERMLGISVDITDRKMAEEALEDLSGRLIAAQDEERRRIARNIHDDYNQRLAVLAIDLEELSETASPGLASRLRECCADAGRLGADLHSLSYNLHSSTLERLGLEAGAKAFCEEFASQHSLEIDFHADLKSQVLPGDAALCFFRILQEALRNIKKHSGASSAAIRLEISNQRAHLSVCDCGNGFDLKAGSKNGGIGIRSMEERLRLVGGKLEVHSHPMEGTRIDAWLPFEVPTPLAAIEERPTWKDGILKRSKTMHSLVS